MGKHLNYMCVHLIKKARVGVKDKTALSLSVLLSLTKSHFCRPGLQLRGVSTGLVDHT